MPSVPCPFCDRMHAGEYIDEIDREIMACRDRASALKRGDLEAQVNLETFTVRCEAAVPATITGTQDSAMVESEG